MKDPSGNAKPSSYFSQARPGARRRCFRAVASGVCWTWAAGRAASVARCATASTSWPASSSSREFAAEARTVYDQVLTGKVEDVIDALDGPFDTILAYDLLEHLVAARATSFGACARSPRSDALLHVSVPNARHWSLVRDLVVRGTFGYTDWGHRDRRTCAG